MRKVFRKNKSLRHYLQTAFACTALILGICVISSCSGYGSEYTDEKSHSNWYDDDDSSSSYGKSSSSSNKYSSSSYYYSSYDMVVPSSSSYIDTTTTVKTVADLDSCTDGEKRTVLKDSSVYRCVYSVWFKEIKAIPECTEKNESETFYKNAPYICMNGNWRELSEIEAKLGVCTNALAGTTKTTDNKYYKCDSTQWRVMTLSDVTGECTSEKNGKTASYGDTSYVCRGTSWQKMTEIELDSGVCSKDRFGDILRVKPRSSYYDTTYYVCNNYAWTTTTDPADIIGACDSSKADTIYKVAGYSYVCDNKAWRKTTSVENSYGLCNSKNQGALRSSYICDKGEWRTPTAEEYYGACTDSLKDVLYTYNSKTYACFNLKWNELPEPPVSSMSLCTKKNDGTTYRTTTTPRAYYLCSNYEWQKIDSLSYTYGMCSKDSLGVRKIPHKDSLGYECKETSTGYSWTRLTINDYAACTAATQDSLLKGYVCDDGSWRLQTALEKSIGLCTTKNNGEKVKSGTSYYECTSGSWKSITEAQYSLGECTTENDSAIAVYKNVQYLCANKKWATPSVENDTTSCPSAVAGWLVSHKNRIHQCASYNGNYAWRYVGDIAIQEGLCREKNQGKVVHMDSTYYICKSDWWYKASLSEIINATPCGETINVNGIKYTCSGSEWAPVYEMMKDSRDGQSYKTLKLAGQSWMVENLNYKTTDSWCYQNIERNCETYGRHYTWKAAQTACPSGWHLPDAYEYNDLFKTQLKSEIRDSDYWQDYIYDNSQSYSLIKLRGAGLRLDNGTFDYERRFAGLWFKDSSLTSADTAYAYINVNEGSIPAMYYSSSNIHHFEMKGNTSVPGSPSGYRFTKGTGLNVRCVKDE